MAEEAKKFSLPIPPSSRARDAMDTLLRYGSTEPRLADYRSKIKNIYSYEGKSVKEQEALDREIDWNTDRKIEMLNALDFGTEKYKQDRFGRNAWNNANSKWDLPFGYEDVAFTVPNQGRETEGFTLPQKDSVSKGRSSFLSGAPLNNESDFGEIEPQVDTFRTVADHELGHVQLGKKYKNQDEYLNKRTRAIDRGMPPPRQPAAPPKEKSLLETLLSYTY